MDTGPVKPETTSTWSSFSTRELGFYAVAGIAATAGHSAVMGSAKALGLMHNPPPRQITTRAAEKLGFRSVNRNEDALTVSWVAAHIAYGIGLGLGYGMVRRVFPRSAWLTGPLYGVASWAVSYLGYLPALGLYPSPEDDSTSRQMTLVTAHFVFGSILAAVESIRD